MTSEETSAEDLNEHKQRIRKQAHAARKEQPEKDSVSKQITDPCHAAARIPSGKMRDVVCRCAR